MIFHCLTEGGIPIQCSFLLNGMIHTWNPLEEYLSVQLIDDDLLCFECETYLQRIGAVFFSISEVIARAETQKWPNWGAIKKYVNKST